jgi:hypothetical protein
MIYVFTAAAANYLPKVKLLFNSLKKNHPEFTLYLALADKMPGKLNKGSINADEIITISDLGIANLNSWIFCHSIVELSTGIKPFMLQYLLEKKDCEAVFYFDPDMVVFSRLDDLVREFKSNSILLTPHQTKPETTLEAVVDNEMCSLKHGIFNLGFIGVKSDTQGKSFAKWWSERVYYFCLSDFNRGIFVDQKWIDFVPVFFDNVKILKSSRFNVATWNITTRKFWKESNGDYMVDGNPLGFYHFTGFDSGAHEIMASKYAGNNAAIHDLINWYKKSERLSGNIPITPWAYISFDNGVKITELHRLIYRTRKDLQDKFPDPFKVIVNGRCYFNWFTERAKIEYPELMDVKGENKSSKKIQPRFSTKFEWSKVWKYLRRATRNYHDGKYLAHTAVSILRKEGIKGLKRHMNSGY